MTEPAAVESPTDRVLQVVRANPGDRLIIRVAAVLDEDELVQTRDALLSLNPGVEITILAVDGPVAPEPEFLEQACEVYFAASQDTPMDGRSRRLWADQPDDIKATARASMWALWEWMTNGGGWSPQPQQSE